MDEAVNLRESIKGPIEQYSDADGKPLSSWNYMFEFPEFAEDAPMTLPFDTLGLAILVDCNASDKQAASAILASLLLQPSFTPTATDFVSFVTICLSKRYSLLLKAFLMSFKMQYIFSSFRYGDQRTIVRMMMGLSPDGTERMNSVFEPSVTLERPYQLFTLIEMLESSHLISKQDSVAKELLVKLTGEQLVLASYIDRSLIEKVVTTDQVVEQLKAQTGAS